MKALVLLRLSVPGQVSRTLKNRFVILKAEAGLKDLASKGNCGGRDCWMQKSQRESPVGEKSTDYQKPPDWKFSTDSLYTRGLTARHPAPDRSASSRNQEAQNLDPKICWIKFYPLWSPSTTLDPAVPPPCPMGWCISAHSNVPLWFPQRIKFYPADVQRQKLCTRVLLDSPCLPGPTRKSGFHDPLKFLSPWKNASVENCSSVENAASVQNHIAHEKNLA